jgi:hypothetical protein
MPDSSYFGGAQAGLPSAPMGQFMPAIGQFKWNEDPISKGMRNIEGGLDQGAAGPFRSLWNYVSGTGALKVGDDTGTLSLAPGGSFELRSPQGFSVTGNPRDKSIGADVPVNIGGNKGTVGVQGSWNSFDPSIQAKFVFEGNRQLPSSSPEQAVNAALTPKDVSYTYQTPFNTTSQQNWNIKNDTSKEDLAQSMWFAPRTAGFNSQYDTDAMKPEVRELLNKTVQKVNLGGSNTGYDMDSLTSWLSGK